MNVLEGDEDETMHYGALSQGSMNSSGRFQSPWQPTSNCENTDQNQGEEHSEVGLKQPESGSGSGQQEDKAEGMDSLCIENSHMDSEYEKLKLASAMNQLTINIGMSNGEAIATGAGTHQPSHQRVGSGIDIQRLDRPSMHQLSPASGWINKPVFSSGRGRQQTNGLGVANRQASNSLDRRKNIPFALFLPVIQPLLDSDKILQLKTLNQALKRNEITKEAFVRRMRTIVGDQILKMAVYKLQEHAKSNAPVAGQQLMQVPIIEKVSVASQNQASQRPAYDSLRQTVAHRSWLVQNMMNAPMAEMPNNPPLQQNAFQFYTGNNKEQRNLVPLPMTYAKSDAVENADPGNSKNDGLEMQLSKLGVSASTSQMDNHISGGPGWMDREGYAPSRYEKRLLKEKLEQMGRVIAERELELAECKAERDLLVDKNLVLKQQLENEKMHSTLKK